MYGEVPPPAVKTALPVLLPLQSTLVTTPLKVSAVGSVSVIDFVPTQLLASVTVTIYEPAYKLVALAVV